MRKAAFSCVRIEMAKFVSRRATISWVSFKMEAISCVSFKLAEINWTSFKMAAISWATFKIAACGQAVWFSDNRCKLCRFLTEETIIAETMSVSVPRMCQGILCFMTQRHSETFWYHEKKRVDDSPSLQWLYFIRHCENAYFLTKIFHLKLPKLYL